MASRWPQLIAAMAQSGIDAAGTPAVAGAGWADTFRGMSNAAQMAQQRDLATFNLQARKNQEILDQLDYLRSMRQTEETERHNLQVEQQARETQKRLEENATNELKLKQDAVDEAKFANSNKLYTDLANQPDYSSVNPISSLRMVYGSMPGQLRQPATPLSSVDGTATSTLLTPEEESARSGSVDLQFPMDVARKLTAGDTAPTDTDRPSVQMSDLPFISPMAAVTTRTSAIQPTLVPRDGHELVRGAELRDRSGNVIAGMQKRTDEQKLADTLASKGGNTQIVKVGKPDGPHSVLIDKLSGDEIADLGSAPPNETSTQTERYVDEWLVANQLPRTTDNINKAIRARALAGNVGGVYPVVRDGNIVYADRAGALGQSAPRTLYDIAGNPTVGGQPGSTNAPPVPAATTQQRLAGFKLALDQANVINDILNSSTSPADMFGPLAGRVTLAEVNKLGGLGATPQQIELATRLQRFLSSQAFADGGKQLTPTELEQFKIVSPDATDTLERAIIKTRLAIEFIKNRGKADLDAMPERERAQFGNQITGAFGYERRTPVGAGGLSPTMEVLQKMRELLEKQ